MEKVWSLKSRMTPRIVQWLRSVGNKNTNFTHCLDLAKSILCTWILKHTYLVMWYTKSFSSVISSNKVIITLPAVSCRWSKWYESSDTKRTDKKGVIEPELARVENPDTILKFLRKFLIVLVGRTYKQHEVERQFEQCV